MKVYGLRIFVDDLDAARAFYGETLGLAETWRHDALRAVGYRLEPVELIVEETSGDDAALVGRFVGVSLHVDDITATHAALAAKGVIFEGPPETMSWGGTLAHFRDPAGNVLTLLG